MIGRIIRFHLRILIRISISFVSTGERNNEFFEFICLTKCLQLTGDDFIYADRDFQTSMKLLDSSHFLTF